MAKEPLPISSHSPLSWIAEHPGKTTGIAILSLISGSTLVLGVLLAPGVNVMCFLPEQACYGLFAGSFLAACIASCILIVSQANKVEEPPLSNQINENGNAGLEIRKRPSKIEPQEFIDRIKLDRSASPKESEIQTRFSEEEYGGLIKLHTNNPPPYQITESDLAQFRQGNHTDIRCIPNPQPLYYYGADGFLDYRWGCKNRNLQSILEPRGISIPYEEIHRQIRSGIGQTPNYGVERYAVKLLDHHNIDCVSLRVENDLSGGKFSFINWPRLGFFVSPTFSSYEEKFQRMLDWLFSQGSKTQFISFILQDGCYSYNLMGMKRFEDGSAQFLIGDPHRYGRHALYTVAFNNRGEQIANSTQGNRASQCFYTDSASRISFYQKFWQILVPTTRSTNMRKKK